MKTLVIDASVIIKWIFPEKNNEDGVFEALSLLKSINKSEVKILQPPHWLAEVIAVIARLEPRIAEHALDLLSSMEFPTINTPDIYRTACQLSERYKHHLFDTLYHAVAIEHGNASFITADQKYFQKAHKHGAIHYLENIY